MSRNGGIFLVRRPTTNQFTLDEEGGEIKGGVVYTRSDISPPYKEGLPRLNSGDIGERIYVSSLFNLCLDLIRRRPALIDSISHTLPPPQAARCIHTIIRHADDVRYVHPLTWLSLVQACAAELNDELLTYPNIALSDPHILDLGRCPPTSSFCLLLHLNLSGSSNLDDTTIRQLATLDNLCTLDTSRTELSDAGVQALSQTLFVDRDGQVLGPWRLRVWKLAGCRKITRLALEYMRMWPLLCGLDLRGTSIRTIAFTDGWKICEPGKEALFGKDVLSFILTLAPDALPCRPAQVFVNGEQYAQRIRSEFESSTRASLVDAGGSTISNLPPNREQTGTPSGSKLDMLKAFARSDQNMACALQDREREWREREWREREWQNTVIEEEAQIHQRAADALRFYQTFPQSEPIPQKGQDEPPKRKITQLFYRIPIPYSALATAVEAVKQAKAVSEAKVQKFQTDEACVAVARKRQRPIPPVVSLYTQYTTGSQSQTDAKGVAATITAGSTSASPFARRLPASKAFFNPSLPGSTPKAAVGQGRPRTKLALFRPA